MSETVLTSCDHAISKADRHQGRRLCPVDVPHLTPAFAYQFSLFRRQAMHDYQATGNRRARLKTRDSISQPSAASRPIQGRRFLGRDNTPSRRIHRKPGQTSLTSQDQTVGYEFTVGNIAAT